MLHSIRDDLYLVVGSINPETKVASLQIHLNPLVGWIWFGCLVLIFGSFICMWPELEPQESRAWQVARGAGAVTASITLGIILRAPARSQRFAAAATTRSQHSGSVQIDDMKEKQVFGQLRCMCGTCPRELLSYVRVLDGRRDARRASAARLATRRDTRVDHRRLREGVRHGVARDPPEHRGDALDLRGADRRARRRRASASRWSCVAGAANGGGGGSGDGGEEDGRAGRWR